MKPNHYIPLILLILLIFTGGCGDSAPNVSDNLKQQSNLCQFSQSACTKTVNNINVKLTITPESAPSEKPLLVLLNFDNPVSEVHYRLEGRDMFMGVIPGIVNQTNAQQFEGPLVYGACSSGFMVWRMFVSFKTDDGEHVAIFDFLADNDTQS
ncbi:hypothetical protein ACFOD0_01650 [Shewanella intestini]|uniref:Lipoprotein n=1 Tax=Shewanella intestini TaxID=2017544 RepID=A0ABS5HZR8_9GAMM|nr:MULTISPECIES: hypothetical protein [Shewanella]MBR9727271.1 hypothetical protein [Shewanella intestini]MRG36073.1 hypothetical protein [Shewanella sp. XMDDZSB0408]